ncbi:MAG: hypothetical protein FJ044_01255 [Candidatus Cloacimonetes bacterium]|nr:hypothetical protein [Candidatus Cloacimonadota bacterium]
MTKEIPRLVKSSHYKTADKLLELRKNKGPWAAIDEIVKLWKKINPDRWDAYVIRLKDIKATRRNPKFADSGKTNLRYLIDIPAWIIRMIRALYHPDELKMDRKFWFEFGGKYPAFRIPEKF